MTDEGELDRLTALMEDMPIGMFTTLGPDGPRAVPMARQQVAPGAEMWFITARDTQHVSALEAEPRVVVTFQSRSAWVAVTGTARLVDDQARLEELWTTFAEAWMPEGPEDPNAALIRVDVERGEYWDTPGGRVASLVSLAKTKVTGETFDADHGVVAPGGGPA
jgi:general stress protein 26